MTKLGEAFAALRGRIVSAHDASTERRIASGMFIVGTFLLLGKLVAMVKEAVVADAYGVGEIIDAYQLAYTIATWLPTFVFSLLTAVMLPSLVGARQRDGVVSPRFLSELMGGAIMIGIASSALSLIVGYATATWPGLDIGPNGAERLLEAVLWTTPLGVLTLVSGVASIRIMAHGHHANTLLEGVPALVIILTVVLFAGDHGMTALLAGTTLGGLIHVLAFKPVLRDGPLLGRLSFSRSAPEWRGIAHTGAVLAIGQLLVAAIVPIDQFVSMRLGQGAVSTLSYANRIAGLVLALGATVVARATLPVFAAHAVVSAPQQLLSQARRWALYMGILGGGGALLVCLLAPWLVQLLYRRGAFDDAAAIAVAEVLSALALQFPFYFAGNVLVSFLLVQRAVSLITWIAAVTLLVKLAAMASLVPLWGLKAVALSTGLMYAVSCLGLWWASNWIVRRSAREKP